MNRFFKHFQLPLLLAFMLLFGACETQTPVSGHYAGTELTRDRIGNIENLQISADFSEQSDGSFLLAVTQNTTGASEQIKITHLGANQWSLEVPELSPLKPTVLQSGNCWSSSTPATELCVSQQSITLDIHDSAGTEVDHLSLAYQPAQSVPTYETPRSFALADAMNIASTQNFDSRIEYEHVLQAKHQARAAYLNLLPHLNAIDIFANLAPGFGSLAGSIGDLAPFLLPTRWLQAKDSKIDAGVENDTQVLVQLSVIEQVEALVYGLKRDQAIIADYQALQSQVISTRDTVAALEKAGTFPVGAADNLTSLIQSMDLDSASLADVLLADRAALSQAMGFFNPEAVIDITFDKEMESIDQAQVMDEQNTTNSAIQQALELDEMDRLSQIAVDQKTSIYFNWLDPSGDYTQDLGFNLGENLEVASSQIQELQIRKSQLEAGIAQNVFSNVQSYNTQIQTWAELCATNDLQEKRLNNILSLVAPNSGVSTLDIQGIFEDHLAASIRKETALAEFRTMRTQLNRALYQGAYTKSSLAPTSAY